MRSLIAGGLMCLSFIVVADAAASTGKDAALTLCRQIAHHAESHNLPKGFFARLLWQESHFNPNAVSPKGAMGIAQFMPGTAQLRGLENPFDPDQAIPASASLLSELRSQFGNLGFAAAAYNAGAGRVKRLLTSDVPMPFETENYVAIITGKSVYDWKKKPLEQPASAYKLPKSADFLSGCVKLAKRRVNLRSNITVRQKLQPWGVQLTENFSATRALRTFRILKKRHARILKGAAPMIIRVRRNSFGRKTRFSVRIGVKTKAAAYKLCRKYFSAGLVCLVRRTQ